MTVNYGAAQHLIRFIQGSTNVKLGIQSGSTGNILRLYPGQRANGFYGRITTTSAELADVLIFSSTAAAESFIEGALDGTLV